MVVPIRQLRDDVFGEQLPVCHSAPPGRNNVVFGENQRLWQGKGDTQANYPDVFSTNANAWSALTYRSSRLWGDASHLRLRNVRFSYEVPDALLRKLRIRQLTAYVSGDNLAVIKRKDFVGADPEGASWVPALHTAV